MTKKFRVLSMVLVVVLVIGLFAACRNEPAAGSAGDETIIVGVLAPLTGPVAQFGTAVEAGVQLYTDQFNARGGVQIQLEWFDEEGSAALGVAGYHDLVDRNATAIIGAVTSGVTMAVVPLAFEDNMPMISATSTHLNVTVDADTGAVFTNMFRSCFIDPFQGYVMANFAAQEVGAQRVAILYNNEVDYSIGLKDAFELQAQALGLEIVAIERFQDTTIDFTPQLANIAGQNPDALFIPAYYQDVALIGPQSAGVGLDTVLLGADGWATILDFMDDTSSVEGAYFLTGFTPDIDEPILQRFVSEFYDATGMQPNMFAAQAYDAAMILFAAIERAVEAGYTANTPEFKAAVIANMAATDLTGVTGHITFDQYNNPQKTAIILHIEGGRETFWGYF